MKAEERKELENNSLNIYLSKAKEFLAGRGGYYVIGSVALLVAVILLWRYVANSRTSQTDERILRLEGASTPEQLTKLMEDNKGNIIGSIAKLHLARRSLRFDGIEKIGTDKPEPRRQAAGSIEKARTLFLELTTELKEKEEPGMLQEAWTGAAQAEEALVGFPKTDEGSDYRGNVDKALEYYRNAVKYFPDSEGTKRLQEKLDKLNKNKDSFVAFQKELYKKRESAGLPPLPPPTKPEDKGTEPAPMPTPPTPNDKKDMMPPPVPPVPPTLPMVPLPPDAKKDGTPPMPPTPPKDEKGPEPRPADTKPK